MRFSPAFLEEVRARLPVSAVVGRKVRLKREGREWRGLSPFTQEKTPSFFVNDQKMRWFDFSAGKNGNIFDFLMEVEGLSFPEAVEKLALEAGVALPAVSREDEAREARRATVVEAMEIAASWFQTQLRGRAGEEARGYLARRGLSEETIETFRLGYAPREKFGLRDHLAGKGVSKETMIEGGLLIDVEEVEVPYDRFRGRVTFPICDRGGKVIAFGGRALDPNVPSKYLNSPETPLFHKGSTLYNHHRARAPAHAAGRVVVVEGYVDVIALAQAGIAEAVAPLGTALTPDQCQLLWRLAEEPILCFDGDAAGRKAAFRAIDTALPLIGEGRTLRFALLPQGQDPDDLARSGGREAVAAVLAQARPLVDMLFARERDREPLDTPERRFALERRLREAARAISDPGLRRHYEEALAARAAEAFGRATGRPGARAPRGGPETGRFGRRGFGGPPAVSEDLARSALLSGSRAISPREALILVLLVRRPALIGLHAEELASLSFAASDAEALRRALVEAADAEEPAPAAIAALLAQPGRMELLGRMERLVGPTRLRGLRADDSLLDADASLRQALALHRRRAALHSELRTAQAALEADPNDQNFRTLRDIRMQLSSLEGMDAAAED